MDFSVLSGYYGVSNRNGTGDSGYHDSKTAASAACGKALTKSANANKMQAIFRNVCFIDIFLLLFI